MLGYGQEGAELRESVRWAELFERAVGWTEVAQADGRVGGAPSREGVNYASRANRVGGVLGGRGSGRSFMREWAGFPE